MLFELARAQWALNWVNSMFKAGFVLIFAELLACMDPIIAIDKDTEGGQEILQLRVIVAVSCVKVEEFEPYSHQ